MDFWKTIVALLRRWTVGPPLIALALVAAGLMYLLGPTHYVSTSITVLTVPTTGSTLSQDPDHPTGLTNPLMNFDDGLKTASTILIQSLNTPEVAAQLGAPAGGPTTITIDDGSTSAQLLGANGPFVMIQGDSTSAAAARVVVARAELRARQELLNRQKSLSAPQSTYIKLVDVVPPSTPEAQLGSKLRDAGAALFVVLLVGFGIAYAAVTGRLASLRRVLRRSKKDPEKDSDAAEQTPPTEVPVSKVAASSIDAPTVIFAPVKVPKAAPAGSSARPTNGLVTTGSLSTNGLVTKGSLSNGTNGRSRNGVRPTQLDTRIGEPIRRPQEGVPTRRPAGPANGPTARIAPVNGNAGARRPQPADAPKTAVRPMSEPTGRPAGDDAARRSPTGGAERSTDDTTRRAQPTDPAPAKPTASMSTASMSTASGATAPKPAAPKPGPPQPGTAQPGTAQPGTAQPGTAQPATPKPAPPKQAPQNPAARPAGEETVRRAPAGATEQAARPAEEAPRRAPMSQARNPALDEVAGAEPDGAVAVDVRAETSSTQ